jgi:hypothetical protein
MNEFTLADVKQEGTSLEDTLKDIVSESLPEDKPEEDAPAVGDVPAEDNLPFHKHPRWIERENELNELKEREEEMARELAELRTSRDSHVATDIPPWFSELYGDNQTAWEKYSEHEQARTEEIKASILSHQQEEEMRAQKEAEHWNKWVDNQIEDLASEGKKFDRNKLIKVMLDYSPTDANNNLDFDKGYSIYEALEGKPDTAKSEARKQLADTTTVTKGETPKKDFLTPAELRNRSWGSL